MDSKLLFVFGIALLAGLALAETGRLAELFIFIALYTVLVYIQSFSSQIPDEFGNFEETRDVQQDESKEEEVSNDEEPKMIMEDMDTETSTALELQNDDPDSLKHKGCKLIVYVNYINFSIARNVHESYCSACMGRTFAACMLI
jgi:hypothetical protein